MTELFGTTRNVVKGRYALLTPGSLVPSHLPGWEKAVCHVLISPALGARFSQVLITLERDGKCAGNTGANQYFVYVLEGAASILLDVAKASPRNRQLRLPSLRPGRSNRQRGRRPRASLVFQKEYQPLPGVGETGGLRQPRARSQRPAASAATTTRVCRRCCPAIRRSTWPSTFSPAHPAPRCPLVEAPVMERGLMILRGQGIYRLEADWHPVQAGDVIWTAPYCPQWFVAMGKTPCQLHLLSGREP